MPKGEDKPFIVVDISVWVTTIELPVLSIDKTLYIVPEFFMSLQDKEEAKIVYIPEIVVVPLM